MSDDDTLKKLLGLKNYENPGDTYFEDFLEQLKERQRRDLLRQSSVSLARERMVQWFNEMGPAKWAVPAGSFATLAAVFFTFGGNNREDQLSHTLPPAGDSAPVENAASVIELNLPKPAPASGQDTPPPLPDKKRVLPASFGGLREL